MIPSVLVSQCQYIYSSPMAQVNMINVLSYGKNGR